MEKKEFLTNYINIVASELTQRGITPTEEQKKQVYDLFINSDKSNEEIKLEIDVLVKNYISRMNNQNDISKEKHYDLNELFDCRISSNTLHIHIVPKSVKEDIAAVGGIKNYVNNAEIMLDDALSKIVGILNEPENENIENVYAVSPTLKLSILRDLFARKGFTVGFTDKEAFRKMFNTDKIGEALISREEFIERYGSKTK